ncbi:MAG: hypothetical protein AABO58_12745 [Acidobacteriota bacterium]
MSLETDLKDALRRVPAPEGFANRVMGRVRNADRHPTRSTWWRAIAATLLLATILGGWEVHRQREGQRAREQVLLALRITGEKVAHVQRGVRDITR